MSKKIEHNGYAVVFENEETVYRVVSEHKIHDGDVVMVRKEGNVFDYEVVKVIKSRSNKIKKVIYLIAFGLILLLFIMKQNSFATSLCPDYQAVFNDDSLCSNVCPSGCTTVNLISSGSSGTCNTSSYRAFVYFQKNNKTYAVSNSQGFWSDFNNLAIIPDQETNDLLKNIINSLNISEAWIGLYDPNQSQNFNYQDPNRFIWRDGSPPSYQNWRSGEPINWIFDEDIGVVPVYGEHWVEMYSDGTWNDEGYHKYFGGDYKPRDYAIVEWNGALDCVNATTSTSSSADVLLTNTCNGTTPCYVCYTNSGFKQCDAGTTTFDYNGTKVSLNQYEGQINVSASGSIDYCFKYATNTQGCPRNNLDAIKSWAVFIGDDGKYYWLGNPNNSPICKGSLTLNTLQYTDNGSSLTITIPQGVRFVEFSDVETLAGQCTGDNKFNLTVTIEPAYLCPANRVQCDATNEEPLCPEGTLNPDRDMCQADANITCPTSGYTWDSSTDKCVMQYQCPENGTLNKQKDRCEKAFTPDCPAGYTADLTNRVCYKQVDCGIGTFNPSLDRCEYPMTKSCPTGYTLNGDICQASPSCPTGTTYSTTLNKCISDYTISCPSGYTWTGQRCETTNIICPNGYSYNLSTNRCEATPSSSTSTTSPVYGIVADIPKYALCNWVLFDYDCPGNIHDYIDTNWWDGSVCEYCDDFTKVTIWLKNGYTMNGKIKLTYDIPDDSSWYIKSDGTTVASGGNGSSEAKGSTTVVVRGNVEIMVGGDYPDGSPGVKVEIWNCNTGQYNETSGLCETTVTTCPDGSTPSGNVCVANPSCPSGGTFDGNADICYTNATKNCPAGTILDNNLNKCVANPTCSYGSLNTTTDLCEIVYTPSCPTGWTYDANSQLCYKSISCDFIYNANRNRCEATLGYDCGSYTYNQTEDICIKDISCPADQNFPLSNTIYYNTNLDICISDAQHDCPSGSNYTYTWNSTPVNKCEAIPICLNGQYNPSNDKCYLGDFTCPLGSQYQCVTMADGKNYCSDLFCGDAQYADNWTTDDTIQGANDKQADGQIDENGNCLGTIYIFNGQDKRCRKPGTQTASNDCCKKDTIKLLGLVNIGKCNSNEVYLSRLRNWGQRDGKCHYVGEYCSEYWEVARKKICVQKKKTFCCFGSVLARIIQEQGRQQLGISWGEPDNPNCRGFTPDEFQKLDFSKIDLSEWIEGEVIPNVEGKLQQRMQNIQENMRSKANQQLNERYNN